MRPAGSVPGGPQRERRDRSPVDTWSGPEMSYPPGPPGGPSDLRRFPPPYGPPPTNGKATASLVVGLVTLVLSWCCGFGLLGVVAVGLGLRAKAEIRRTDGAQPGDGLATAGIATGVLAVLLALVAVAALLLVFAPLAVA